MRSLKRQFAIHYAESFLGAPYEWGGDNPQGFDCSGFVGEVLRSVGLLANNEDLTAGGMFEKFRVNQTDEPGPGCLVFYGKDLKNISHVAIMADNRHVYEAGGGNSTTKTVEDADKRNAFVRARPFSYRTPLAFIDPFQAFPT